MTGANMARAMQLSAPTVHEMVGRLERDGYITRDADRTIAFTASGAEHAEGIVRRHRLIERFLTDVLGVPLGRGARGGRAPGARHVAGARGAHARRDRRRQDMPPRAPDRRRRAPRRRAARRRRGRRLGAGAALRERGRGPSPLPEGLGPRAGPGGHVWRSATRSRWCSRRPTAVAARVTPSVAETVSVIADPSPPPRTALPEQLVLGPALRALSRAQRAKGAPRGVPRPRRSAPA